MCKPWDMLVSRVCLQEQTKQSFFTLPKENQSPLGLYRNPPIFFFSSFCAFNLWPAFCFAVSPPDFHVRHESPAHAWRIRPTSSAGTACMYDSQQKWEKSIYNVSNMDIFLTKMHGFATGGLYSSPGAVWGTFYYRCACFIWRLLDCWTKTPTYSHSNACKSKENF